MRNWGSHGARRSVKIVRYIVLSFRRISLLWVHTSSLKEFREFFCWSDGNWVKKFSSQIHNFLKNCQQVGKWQFCRYPQSLLTKKKNKETLFMFFFFSHRGNPRRCRSYRIASRDFTWTFKGSYTQGWLLYPWCIIMRGECPPEKKKLSGQFWNPKERSSLSSRDVSSRDSYLHPRTLLTLGTLYGHSSSGLIPFFSFFLVTKLVF